MVLAKDRLAEFTNFISTLTDRIEDLDKYIEELESIADIDELRGEKQVAMSSVVADINKEIRALQAYEIAMDGELQACKVEVETSKVKVEAYKAKIEALKAYLKVCMIVVANGGVVQVSTAPNRAVLRPPTFHGARSTREIDNFLWGLEAYFRR